MSGAYWHAVARSADLKRKPLRVLFEGKPFVLFRTSSGVSAFPDRCPHRHVPLSGGKILGDEIECPYHGWRFAPDGKCVAIPGCVSSLPPIRVRPLHVCEKEGGIFVSRNRIDGEPYVHAMEGKENVKRVVVSQTRSKLVDAAENILDATHTHFTHKGLLRGMSAKRYRVQVEVTSGRDWVQAVYTGEDRQEGLVSKMLDGARLKTIGRYRAPGIAELEYWSPKGMVLATTFHLRQSEPDTVEGIGWLTGPREKGLGLIKALAFKPLFKIALEQDRRVLRAAHDNARGAKPVIGPLDFLRNDIMAIEAGKLPVSETRRYEMLL